jgi:thiosulfate/3-mercaptopyruvate sulfurtransferase
MTVRKFIAFAVVAAGLLLASPKILQARSACGAHGTRATMLVSTNWLGDHLKDPNLVIFSFGERADYDAGHIPGAQFVTMSDVSLRQNADGLALEMLPMTKLAEVLGKFGVSNESTIVLYPSKDWFSPMTRIYLTLDAAGMGARTAILDGGFPAWTKEGRPVTQAVPQIASTTFNPCPNSDVIASLSDVQANLHQAGTAIVDGRDAEFYAGDKKSFDRGGHIPGAGSLPFTSVFDDAARLKSPVALAALFHLAGVKDGDRVIVYCHVGQQATVVYFAARTLGYNVRLFDGSWQEWTKKDLPIETAAPQQH